MPDQRGLFDFWADHHAGRIGERQNRDVERLADLQEARCLVRTIRIDGAAQYLGIVRDDTHGPAFNADQRGNHGRTEFGPQFQQRPRICQRFDELPDVIDTHAIFGNDLPQPPLIGAGPIGQVP